MILSPFVEVLKSKNYELENEHANIAVLTVAAPIIRDKQHVSEDYKKLLQERVHSMLLCAAHFGYTYLVLGAWGCGAFGNNPRVVAEVFKTVIDNFSYDGKNAHELFEKIGFAIPYDKQNPINFIAFQEVV